MSVSPMKRLLLLLGLIGVCVALVPTSAGARSFSNAYHGTDRERGTVLWFGSHKPFNIRFSAARYDIKMYVSAGGRPIWQAANQTTRTYYVGSNVHYITIGRRLGSVTSW